mmetsp:Transcript_2705/g.3930  ORF Transcript_2705/g.3930 Transcript_2705/m.3930 type:complete len:86 (+) Transcript_2705:57-314(+)
MKDLQSQFKALLAGKITHHHFAKTGQWSATHRFRRLQFPFTFFIAEASTAALDVVQSPGNWEGPLEARLWSASAVVMANERHHGD